MTDGKLDNQSACPAKNTNFFEKFRIDLMTLSAIDGLFSVNRE